MTTFEQMENNLIKFNQSHLLQFWDELSEDQRKDLWKDIQEVNVAEVSLYFERYLETINEDQQKLDDRMKPIPPHLYGAVTRSTPEELSSYEDEGLLQISKGNVGVLLMAGGQGTRLGVSYPKGMYDVGLPSHKTLYQIQAERIRKLEALACDRMGKYGTITWYIMTSESTKQPTQDFFAKHHYFGLRKENIVIFEQGLLPCFSFDGKIIMDSKFKLSKAPDGNGGLYRALRDRMILHDMEKRGVQYLHAHSVDNILVKVADPVFIGYSIKKGAECGAKVVTKAFPTEAVGVVCEVDGQCQVVEYSEITQRTAEKRNNDGRLTFSAGNICNHFFTRDFLNDIANKYETNLKLHVAKKQIPYVDMDGKRYIPKKPNGIKMEKFIFDVFPFADRFVTWEVQREVEFSALKNGDNAEKDTPTTARNDVYKLHRHYVESAGGTFDDDNDAKVVCEISPLVSYAGEGLRHLVADKTYKSPLLLRDSKEGCFTTNGKTNGVH